MSVAIEKESDEKLMLQYQDGNFVAFNELYSRYSARVYGFLINKTSSKEEASDIMQSAFLKFHNSRHQYSNKFPVVNWLFTITRTVLIDYYRKKKTFPLSLEQEMNLISPDPDISEDENELIIKAKKAIQTLDKDQRQLLNFRFEDGLSYDQISRRLGINSDTLRKRVSRALNLLRKVKNES